MNTQERIYAFCKHKRISIRQFEILSNLSNGYVSSMRKGLGVGKLENVLNAFPDLNREWLLYGEGEMIKKRGRLAGSMAGIDAESYKIPLFDSILFTQEDLFKELRSPTLGHIIIPNISSVDGALYIKGDTMSPLISSGDIVIFKKVEIGAENIIWGNIYIISYTLDGDSYTVLKYLRRTNRIGYVKLESFNPRYDPQEIPTASITALALVKASITFHTIG